MKAKRFEDLFIWQKARYLTKVIYQLTGKKSFSDLSLKDQIRRAAVSILSNIAEGFERGTKEELLHFLYIARASCGELRTQNYVALDQKYISPANFQKIKELSEFVSRLIFRFIESVKSSRFQGAKFRKIKKEDDIDKWLKKYLPKHLRNQK